MQMSCPGRGTKTLIHSLDDLFHQLRAWSFAENGVPEERVCFHEEKMHTSSVPVRTTMKTGYPAQMGDNSIRGERVRDSDRALVMWTRKVECGQAGEISVFCRTLLWGVPAAGTVLRKCWCQNFWKIQIFFLKFQKSNMVPIVHIIEHSWWSLAWHTVNKPINIPVAKCINIHTKWDNKDYKQLCVGLGQVLLPNKLKKKNKTF